MTGRGIDLRSLKKKEDNESCVQSNITGSSKVASSILTIGRGQSGRGFAFPDLTRPNLDETSSTTTIGRGRGLFSVKIKQQVDIKTKTSIENSDPVTSGNFSGSPSKEDGITPPSMGAATSGIIAGRGISSSAKRSSEVQQVSVSTGATKKEEKLEISANTSIETTQPLVKKGESGTPFNAICNSIPLHCNPDAGVFEYEVRFSPAVDNVSFRHKYLNQHKATIGTKTFDGVILFLAKRLPDSITNLASVNVVETEPNVNIQIIFKRKKRLGESIQLYNLLFERVFRTLQYNRIGRKMFNPNAPQLVPQHKLEIWPGYVKSVEELEGGLMLTLDVSHRVLATRTVLELFTEAFHSNRSIWKEEVKKALIGKLF